MNIECCGGQNNCVLGFPSSSESAESTEDIVLPYISILAEFRDKVRSEARNIKATEILKECDQIRDDILPNVGVRLEDKDGMLYNNN